MATPYDFGACIIPNPKYDDKLHASAIELGQFLASYEVFFCPGYQPDDIFDENRRIVLESVESLVEHFGLPISNVFGRSGYDHSSPASTVLTIIGQIQAQRGPQDCVFLLIGQCSRFICYAATCRDLNDKRNGQEVAQSRLNEIGIRWPDLHIACDALWQILVSKSSDNLTTNALRRFLGELQRPLKILIISADPQGQDRLRLSEERRELQLALGSTRFRDAFEVSALPSCRIRDITRALDEYEPTILHFSGHGNPEGLCFENEAGTVQIVSKVALGNFFCQQSRLKLVVLNACYSHEQAQGIADATGHVIAMKGNLRDQDAVQFSREFYTALGHGRTFEAAFTRAKYAVELDSTSTLNASLLKSDKRPD